jgi:hypothetical protein
MSGVVQFVFSILKIAIFLAVMGDLTTVTKLMMNSAAKAHQHKGISFVQMNKMLVGKSK